MVEETQRRLSAIVSADVAGYSRLMGVDEAGTLRRLNAHRAELIDPLITRHGGRIVKTSGDGLLLEFSSVVAAVTAMVAVQDGMAARNVDTAEDEAIRFRIGVHLGDVIVEGDDIFGDGVNIAARLQEIAEVGGVTISHTAQENVSGRIDAVFVDTGEQSLKNIANPVRAWRWAREGVGETTTAAQASDEPTLPDRPSIAVLPFDNMSSDSEQEYFADGMTEDIITELSRFEGLFVIARNTCFIYKGQTVDVKDVARELGVHFVLEGSVRKAGQRVRITAQLIDGIDGKHIWAERYDGELADIFDLQEQVTRQVVASTVTQLKDAETARIVRGDRVFDEAQDISWRAADSLRQALNAGDPDSLERAIVLSLEAIALNSECFNAYFTICASYNMQNLFRWGDDPNGAADRSEQWAKKFLSKAPQSYWAHFCLGSIRVRKGQITEGIGDLRHAHELIPNEMMILQSLSYAEARAGETVAARELAEQAIRLSPKDPLIGNAYLALAIASFAEQNHDEFRQWADRAIREAPNAPIRRALMIAHAAIIGDQRLLEIHRNELMGFAPDFIASIFSGENQQFERPEHIELLLNGLRKAGFGED